MKKKKSILLIALAFLIAIATIGGTMAWLSKKSSVTNTFTVGSIVVPTTDPTASSVTIDIDGNVYEPSWDEEAEHKLMPSATFVKDPYVGIGKGSEDSAVYVYVENTLSNKVYFDINEGWEAVEATSGSKAGAALWAATQVAKRPEAKGKNIVVIFADNAFKYLSTNMYK